MKRNYSGAISLFMIIITMSCFIFGGVFIDAARIVAAKNKVNLAMNSAARSAMSYYDENLVSEYGLYGITNEVLSTNFSKYFTTNMEKTEQEGIKLFKYTVDSSEMSGKDKFTDKYSEQILEYEKYRAPVTTTMALIDRIKDALAQFKKSADRGNDGIDSFEKLQNQVKSSKKNLSNVTKSIATNIKERLLSDVKTLIVNYENAVANDVVKELNKDVDTMKSDVQAEIDKCKQELEKLKEERQTYQEKVDSIRSDLENSYSNLESSSEENEGSDEAKKYEKILDNLDEQINNMQSKIDGMESELNNITNELNEESKQLEAAIVAYQNAIREKETAENDLAAKKKELDIDTKNAEKNKVDTAKQTITTAINSAFTYLDDEEKKIYEEFKKSVDGNNSSNQQSLIDANADNEDLQKLFQNYKDLSNKTKESKKLETQINAANNQINEYQSRIDELSNDIEQKEKNIDTIKSNIEVTVERLSNISAPELGEILVEDLEESLIDTADNDKTIIGQIKEAVEQLTETMPSFNGAGEDDDYKSKNPLTLAKKIVNDFTSFVDMITDFEKIRNQIYYVDYVMNNCTYLTSQVDREHYFKYGEVEYIIYGKESQLANIGCALGSIYIMRTLINSINYFATSVNPELISRFVEAITKGALQAIADMKDMIIADDNSAPGCALCPSVKDIKLYYSDHLRLLLLWKSTNIFDGLTNTMDSTLGTTKGGSITTDMYTSGEAKVEVEVNLIMIPIFADMLPNNNYFRNGNFVIHDSTTLSY